MSNDRRAKVDSRDSYVNARPSKKLDRAERRENLYACNSSCCCEGDNDDNDDGRERPIF